MSEAKSKKQVPKLSERIANKIRKTIVRGEVKSGDNLPSESEMMAQFQASRPTIREAIRLLEVERLIAITKGARSGPVVLPLNLDMVTKATGIALQIRGATLGDVYEARALIEPLAVRMAAENRPKEAAEALRAMIPQQFAQLAEGTRMAFITFHREVLNQSGNATLSILGSALAEIDNRHSRILLSRSDGSGELKALDEPNIKRFAMAIRSIDRLVTLIGEGKAQEAEQHWQRHMRVTAQQIPRRISSMSVIDILD